MVFIDEDSMDRVFDCDPLIRERDEFSSNCHYQTQEHLITRFLTACDACEVIDALEIFLSKRAVLRQGGQLGVRLALDNDGLSQFRPMKNG